MNAYSITREDAAEDHAALGYALNAITEFGGTSLDTRKRLQELADSIQEQLPAPIPDEPTGDSLVWVWGEVYARQVDIGEFWSMTSSGPRYTWADMWAECRRTNSAAPVIYDRRVATPPTEEVAEPAKHKQSCEWPECPGNEDCEGLSLLSEVTMGITLPAEADPLEALYAELKDEWELDAGDWVILRNFVERVRALTTEDTVPPDKVRELEAAFRKRATKYPNSLDESTWLDAAGLVAILLPKAVQS